MLFVFPNTGAGFYEMVLVLRSIAEYPQHAIQVNFSLRFPDIRSGLNRRRVKYKASFISRFGAAGKMQWLKWPRALLCAALFEILFAGGARAATLYVDLNNANAAAPFGTWATAATNIQDAVDAAANGDVVLVTNGIYATGGRNWFGSGTNRVTLTNTVILQSVNGPAFTWIVGNRVAGVGSALTNAARCVYLSTNNAIISGFTLTNGEAGTGNYPAGGGVVGGIVTNCILTGNLATNSAGGGAYRATLIDCQFIGNSSSSGGGACACTLTRCTVVSNTAIYGGGIFGGGVYGASALTNCAIAGNSASFGGGAYGGMLTGCSLSNNLAIGGGGAYNSVLNNCRLVGNSAGTGGGASGCNLYNSLVVGNTAGSGGGLYSGTISNCTVASNAATNSGGGVEGGGGAWCYNSILYHNFAPSGSNNIGTKFNNCCTQPNFSGGGITNEPRFVNLAGGDFHLQSNSPCINSGGNGFVSGSVDLEGNPRIAGGTVDIGCYEFPTPGSTISYAWLQQYSLPTDGSADRVDSDGDGASNFQEWIAATDPTNALSRLVMTSLVPSGTGTGLSVTWQSVAAQVYYLQRSTNLAQPAPFSSILSNIFGKTGFTSYIDRSATNPVPYFYRVGIQ
jgi:hypothetical protein